jgi:hypothetical protein
LDYPNTTRAQWMQDREIIRNSSGASAKLLAAVALRETGVDLKSPTIRKLGCPLHYKKVL